MKVIPLAHFIERGGFPEPFLAQEKTDVDRWRMQYVNGLIRYDILDFKRIQELKAIETVFEILRERVGSPISYRSISEDVGISPNTIKKYIQILESLFIVFKVTPFSKNIARSLLKEPKIYFYDNGLVKGGDGILFENLVAISLLKKVYEIVDLKGIMSNLHYLRTRDGKEVDFCYAENGEIKFILEAKISDTTISKTLKYFQEKYNLPAIQLVMDLKRGRKIKNIEILKAESFLKKL